MSNRTLGALRAFLGQVLQGSAVPGPLDMRDDTPVWVTLENGRRVAGRYRGAAPDGSYAVMLDTEPGCLRAFDCVKLRRIAE